MNTLVNSYVTLVSVMREQRRAEAAAPARARVEPPVVPAVAEPKKGRLSVEARALLAALRPARAEKPEPKKVAFKKKQSRVEGLVMLALADGLRPQEVSAKLHISHHTIYQHIYRVRKRYGETSARGAVLRFVSERIALRQAAADLEYLSWGPQA